MLIPENGKKIVSSTYYFYLKYGVYCFLFFLALIFNAEQEVIRLTYEN